MPLVYSTPRAELHVADEPPDGAAFADLVRQAADADAGRVKDLADRVDTLDAQVREAAARVAAYRQDAGTVTERRTLRRAQGLGGADEAL